MQLAIALTAIASISAAPLPSVEDHIRQGNVAFHQGQFEQALKLYAQAERFTLDPGLVAFNQGVALFRLERFDESVQCFRRSLEDAAIPAARRARAYYDLGNALVRASKSTSAALLEQAAQAYRACLMEPGSDDILRADAAHNLEVARLLWREALTHPQPDPPGSEPNPQQPKNQEPKKLDDDPKNKTNGAAAKDDPTKKGDQAGVVKDKVDGSEKKNIPGALQVLPEMVEKGEVTPAQSAAFLEEQARRIRAERRLFRRDASQGPPGVPNW